MNIERVEREAANLIFRHQLEPADFIRAHVLGLDLDTPDERDSDDEGFLS